MLFAFLYSSLSQSSIIRTDFVFFSLRHLITLPKKNHKGHVLFLGSSTCFTGLLVILRPMNVLDFGWLTRTKLIHVVELKEER